MNTDPLRINNEWVKKLKTGRIDLILSSLKELRNQGNDSILPEIMELMSKFRDDRIHTEVIGILNDLNNQSSVEIFMENLINHRHSDYFVNMVSSCWQNGLDYSAYTGYFIDIVLKDDYATSVEAFTVVESNVANLENRERDELADVIEKAKKDIAVEKLSLVNELHAVVKPFAGPFKMNPSP